MRNKIVQAIIMLLIVVLCHVIASELAQSKEVHYGAGTEIMKDISCPASFLKSHLKDYTIEYTIRLKNGKIWTLAEKTARGWRIKPDKYYIEGEIISSVKNASKIVGEALHAKASFFSADGTRFAVVGSGEFYVLLPDSSEMKVETKTPAEFSEGNINLISKKNIPTRIAILNGFLEFPSTIDKDLNIAKPESPIRLSTQMPILLSPKSKISLILEDTQEIQLAGKKFHFLSKEKVVKISVDRDGYIRPEWSTRETGAKTKKQR